MAIEGLIIPGELVNSQKTDTPPERPQISDTQQETPKKRGRGHPSLLSNQKVLERIYQLARDGKTDQEIADIMGVTNRTISNWKLKDLVFASILRENKEIPDSIVESKLFNRAVGYDYTEEFVTKDGVTEVRKHAPPDVSAISFWLKNRQSRKWRDRQDHEVNVVRTIEFSTPNGITKI
jgi:hypothetical protein